MSWALVMLAAGLPISQAPNGVEHRFLLSDPNNIVIQQGKDDPKKKDNKAGGETPKTKDPVIDTPIYIEGESKKENGNGDDADADSGPARLFPNSRFEQMYDKWDAEKKATMFPFTIGAWHWGHINNGGPNATDYGIPGIQGTYFWYIVGDPVLWINPNENGFVKSAGAHFDFRFRENDRFRNFFREGVWFWENYAYLDTTYGKIKGGQIWRRFGLDWDGTFWGNVPYFDGFKLDPDWGFSWENTWDVRDKLKVNTYVQYFIREDGVNGSIAGGDSESFPGYTERQSGVVRILPIWQVNDDLSVAAGASAMVSQLDSDNRFPGMPDDVNSAWALDMTVTYKKFKVFCEYLESYGVRNPVRYVSGGPSNRISSALAGMSYQLGPVLLRCSYSAGWDANPNGWQELWVPGMTVALTKNLDFLCEYVRWDVHGTSFAEFEDGFQLILNWRF